ncbi:MAG: prephenate dehydrogenase/arogenate dehydrogenase family protein, partial [Tissierellia bacterium]|nr:prephenate dehydrogenase/arogenate dehydrogenase family protein [Tissierellia bacterium]
MQEFEEIAIIGMGLIGGSLALALKNSGYTGKIIAYDISKATLIQARGMGIIDSYCENPRETIKNADLIIMAVPVGYYGQIFQQIASYIPLDTIVTDVGSVKVYVEEIAKKYLPDEIQFVGGHPMAGSEKGGIGAASPSLYENAYYFLTPSKNTTKDTIIRLEKLVKEIRAYPVVIEATEHDKIVAQISHIPHLTAVMLANLLERNNGDSYLSFVGGGFRDSTRIASGNPYMWQDIFLFNKNEILRSIET